jgi:siroheme synthase (precorrin-2 oxidase/ferrochelatase)
LNELLGAIAAAPPRNDVLNPSPTAEYGKGAIQANEEGQEKWIERRRADHSNATWFYVEVSTRDDDLCEQKYHYKQ